MSTLDCPVKGFEKKLKKTKRKRKEQKKKEKKSRAFRPTTICHSDALGTDSLHHTSLAFGLGINDSALQRAR